MSSGRQNALLFGLGLSIGLAFWGVIAATGLGVILQTSEFVLIALKIFGGAYLLLLAYQSAVSTTKKSEHLETSAENGSWFIRGLILNLSNPKAVVAWMAALSMGLGVDGNPSQVIAATAICMAIGFANYTGHALAFSISGIMSAYQRFRRWFEGIVAGLFALAGFSLIRSAFSR